MLPKVTHKVFFDIVIHDFSDKAAVTQRRPDEVQEGEASPLSSQQGDNNNNDNNQNNNNDNTNNTKELKKYRLVLGLFGDTSPLAVQNFVALCRCDYNNNNEKEEEEEEKKGVMGDNNVHTNNNKKKNTNTNKNKMTVYSNQQLCYRHSYFHRIIPNFMIQGGDITHGDGTGGTSIYNNNNGNDNNNNGNGGGFANDPKGLTISFNRRYLLAMAASSHDNNANKSQFFINTVKTQWLDGKHVVLGVVMGGTEEVVRTIGLFGSNGGKPRGGAIEIVDSGELELTEEEKRRPIPVAMKDSVS